MEQFTEPIIKILLEYFLQIKSKPISNWNLERIFTSNCTNLNNVDQSIILLNL